MSNKPYQQSGDYMPNTDAGFRSWLLTFSSLIAESPETYNLSESDSAIISNLYSQYDELFNLCQSTATRTTGLVTQKDAIKASARATCRVYAMQLKSNQGLTNQQKIQLGLHINDTVPSPILAPDSSPMLVIRGAFSGEHIIEYADENTPSSKRKPHGSTQLELWVHVGPQPIVNPDDAKSVGVFTKNPIRYSFNPEKAGMTATYFARWRTARGLDGPMSLPVAMQIAFGGPVDQQMPTGGTQFHVEGDDQLKIAA